MKLEVALNLLDKILDSEKLNNVQEAVFTLSWQGKTYQKIAQKTGYDRDYIKDVGCRLWQTFSQKLGTKVTKSNFRTVLRQYAQQEEQENNQTEVVNLLAEQSKSAQDWGEAIDFSFFVGREIERKQLQKWIQLDHSQLITIVGMGGVGKTAIATQITQQLKAEFKYIFWRSLRNAPPLKELLIEFIMLVSEQQKVNHIQSINNLINLTIKYLENNRCLLIFDNIESIFKKKELAGKYRLEFEDYGQLFEIIADQQHQSCLIITSREKPANLELKETALSLVRSLPLSELSSPEANSILRHQGLAKSQSLVERYTGNPLVLKIAATTIKSLFSGNSREFLKNKIILYGDIWNLLEEQFNRLSSLEQTVMYWLAINRQWTTLSQLEKDIFPKVYPRQILEAIESLKRRSLIELNTTGFTQLPIIMQYIIEQLLETIVEEITTLEITLFSTHALIKTQAKDYIQKSQIRFIVEPLVEKLISHFGSKSELQQQLKLIIVQLQNNQAQAGYGAGNILNLFRYLQTDLTGVDFSHLPVWQANKG